MRLFQQFLTVLCPIQLCHKNTASLSTPALEAWDFLSLLTALKIREIFINYVQIEKAAANSVKFLLFATAPN